MQPTKKLPWLKNLWRSQLWLFFGLLVVLALIIWPMTVNLNKKSQLDREIEQLKSELAKNEAQNNDFKKMIAYLDSDQFVEEQARLTMNLKKPGEKVALIKDSAMAQPTNQVAAERLADEPTAPFSVRARLNRWLDYFFN